MGKITYVFVFLIFAAIGGILYIYAPSFSPLTLIQMAPQYFQSCLLWIQQNTAQFITTIAGVGTIITLFYNQLYKRAKEAQEQLAIKKVGEAQEASLKILEQNQQLTQKLDKANETIVSMQQAKAGAGNLQKTIDAQTLTIEKLTAERNQAYSLANSVIAPTDEELIKMAKKRNLTLVPTVK